jgi:peptide/nickel transport system substrate-binding protein
MAISGPAIRPIRRVVRVAALVAALAGVAVACGDDGGSSDSSGSPATSAGGATTTPPTTKPPVKGGSVTFATFAAVNRLDSVMITGSGNAGAGNELGALYDRLVDWDPASKKYVPKTAESVTPNADFTQWTIKIRPNIKFTDGTAYDAAAVKAHLERSKTPPAGATGLGGVLQTMTAVTVVDALTAQVTLSEPWAQFIFVLTMGPGMVQSPTALAKQGANYTNAPVGGGAGPFEFVSFKAGESLILKRNENYWGGPAYLDEIKFVFIGPGPATLDALKTGTADIAFFKDALSNDNAKKAKYDHIETSFSSGSLLIMNLGVEVTCTNQQPAPTCTGKTDGTKVAPKTATSDIKVRQAVFNAIDVDAVDQRQNSGVGIPAKSLLDKSFPWDPGVPLPKADPAKAKQLVTEAKTAGWDGKIRLNCNAANANAAIAIETMLKAAGMEVDSSKTGLETNAMVSAVAVQRDFDLSCWGFQLSPDDYPGLELNYRSTSTGNRVGYKNPTMDAAILELKKANTDDAKKAAYKKIADQFNTDVIAVPLSHAPDLVAWNAKVKGAKATSQTSLLLEKVWIDK